jgi:pyruvate dehydrogenase (quinone)
VQSALQHAVSKRGVSVIVLPGDVVTDPNVLSMPPRATIQQAEGFALAMMKMAFTGELEDVTDTVMANWR